MSQGSEKGQKKCHVLFEWPLTGPYLGFLIGPKLYDNETLKELDVIGPFRPCLEMRARHDNETLGTRG